MSQIEVAIKGHISYLSGELIRQTVPTISVKQWRGYYKQTQVVIDLANVAKVDTAGLAWLLTQVEIAQANTCQISFEHLPSSLIKLAQLSSVDALLPKHSPS